MNKLYFVAFGSMLASLSFAQTLSAVNDSVIETTGTYSSNSTYMNFGLASGKYNSFAVLDFNASSISGDTIDAATLTLTHSDYTSSKPTVVTIFAVTDNTSNIGSTNTSIVYGTGAGFTNGIGTQLGTVTDLGSFTYTPNLVNVNTQDGVSLTNLSALTALVGTPSSDIRLVVTSDQLGLATYFGTKGTSAPTLTLRAAAVPEPASFIPLAIGGVVLIRRRRKA